MASPFAYLTVQLLGDVCQSVAKHKEKQLRLLISLTRAFTACSPLMTLTRRLLQELYTQISDMCVKECLYNSG